MKMPTQMRLFEDGWAERSEPKELLRCRAPGCPSFGKPLIDMGKGHPVCVMFDGKQGNTPMSSEYVKISIGVICDQEHDV